MIITNLNLIKFVEQSRLDLVKQACSYDISPAKIDRDKIIETGEHDIGGMLSDE